MCVCVYSVKCVVCVAPVFGMCSLLQATSAPREKLYKILVIGDLGTGKTSIIKRYVHQCFSPHYRATVSPFCPHNPLSAVDIITTVAKCSAVSATCTSVLVLVHSRVKWGNNSGQLVC